MDGRMDNSLFINQDELLANDASLSTSYYLLRETTATEGGGNLMVCLLAFGLACTEVAPSERRTANRQR